VQSESLGIVVQHHTGKSTPPPAFTTTTRKSRDFRAESSSAPPNLPIAAFSDPAHSFSLCHMVEKRFQRPLKQPSDTDINTPPHKHHNTSFFWPIRYRPRKNKATRDPDGPQSIHGEETPNPPRQIAHTRPRTKLTR
jgi:hypothetical protein